jgi:hypothetical protein
MGVKYVFRSFMRQADLYIAILGVNVRFCRDEAATSGNDRGISRCPAFVWGRELRLWACQRLPGVVAAGLSALYPLEGFPGFVDPFDDGGVQAGEDVAAGPECCGGYDRGPPRAR